MNIELLSALLPILGIISVLLSWGCYIFAQFHSKRNIICLTLAVIGLFIFICGMLAMTATTSKNPDIWDVKAKKILVEEQIIPFDNGRFKKCFPDTEGEMKTYIRLTETDIKEVECIDHDVKYTSNSNITYKEMYVKKEMFGGLLKYENTEAVLYLPSEASNFNIVE